jgi:acetyl-CoA synthetase
VRWAPGRLGHEQEDRREGPQHIDAPLEEDRTFPPPEGFRANAVVCDPSIYDRSAADPEGFWAEEAGRLEWSRPWDTVMEWSPPFVS